MENSSSQRASAQRQIARRRVTKTLILRRGGWEAGADIVRPQLNAATVRQ